MRCANTQTGRFCYLQTMRLLWIAIHRLTTLVDLLVFIRKCYLPTEIIIGLSSTTKNRPNLNANPYQTLSYKP